MEPEEKKRDWISVIEERENICMNPDIWEIWSKEEVKEAVEQTSPAAAPVYLVEGACVQCSKMLPAMFNVRIKVLMKSFDLIYREKWLKDTDTFFQPASFGCCGNPQTPCQPVVQTWLGCSLKTLVGLRPVLTMDSYLICQKGGIITPKTDGQNAAEGKGDKVGNLINEWLQLYDGPTVSGRGRTVTMPAGVQPRKWAMKEGLTNINKYARNAINGSNSVHTGKKKELYDNNGRYWVAVGPKVMNPDHKETKACSAAEMKYGTFLDAVIKDDEGNRYYVPCVVGDCKAHTYPNGIYQTGKGYPNGTDVHTGNVDGSVIEFCGNGSIAGLGRYSIEKIIVYDVAP